MILKLRFIFTLLHHSEFLMKLSPYVTFAIDIKLKVIKILMLRNIIKMFPQMFYQSTQETLVTLKK